MMLLPFLPMILSGLAILGGLGANWWLGFTDWQTAAVFAAALAACAYIAQSKSPFARLAITAVIGMGLYLKGQIDKGISLTAEHEAAITKLHAAYAANAEAERARQAAANRAALADAEKEKADLDAQVKERDSIIAGLRDEASKSPNARRPALDIGAVDRLNARRLRTKPGS